MTVHSDAAQSVCFGCCINPNWYNPPFINDLKPTYTWPTVFNTTDLVKLTPEEKDLLQKLVEAYNLYTALDKRSNADNNEFVDALHRLQQIVALRVARRVDPEVWAQPE